MDGQIQAVKSADKSEISRDFSKRITSLRFILAVLVVFIHSRLYETQGFLGSTVEIKSSFLINFIQEIFTRFLGNGTVPAFFVISSYLLFAKPKSIKDTVKSKLRTIVLPYALWTFLVIAVYFIVQSFAFSKSGFFRPELVIKNWKVSDYIYAFIGIKREGEATILPLVGTFWYLEDLLIFMIFSPLIKTVASRFPLFYFICVFTAPVLQKLGLFNDPYRLTQSLFFFSLGFYAVRYIDGVLAFLDKIKWKDFVLSYTAFTLVLEFLSMQGVKGAGFADFMHIIFTVLLFFKLAGVLSAKEKIYQPLKALSAYSFWVYAAHVPIVIGGVQKIITMIMPLSGTLILIQFFVTAFLTLAILMTAGVFIKRFIPKLFALFTGGRAYKINAEINDARKNLRNN